jgi:hypothetical protein
MAKVGTGHLRGKRTSQPATPQARAIKRASAGNVQVAPVAFDSSPELTKSLRALKHMAPGTHGGITGITGLPASAKAPRPAK